MSYPEGVLLEQAEGLQDWARFQYLDALTYRDEDQDWEHYELRKKLDIPEPPKVLYYNRPFTLIEHDLYQQRKFMASLWADEIIATHKHNLILQELTNG